MNILSIYKLYIKDLSEDEVEDLGNKPLRTLAKLHLNSLYGFFGRHEEVKSYSYSKFKLNDLSLYNKELDLYLNVSLVLVNSECINVAAAAATASSITSYARIHIQKLCYKYFVICIIVIQILFLQIFL